MSKGELVRNQSGIEGMVLIGGSTICQVYFEDGKKKACFVKDLTKAEPAQEIESYGNKGVKSAAWRKTFKNRIAMLMWAEKNDAEIVGIREVCR